MGGFIEKLKGMDGFCPEFDENLWCSLLDCVTVYTKDDVRFTFRGGMEIRV